VNYCVGFPNRREPTHVYEHAALRRTARRKSVVVRSWLALKLCGIGVRSFGWQLDRPRVVGGSCLRAGGRLHARKQFASDLSGPS
jgi:hypothetical protein